MSGDNHVARLFGALLMAVGVLIMALCGLCSLVVLGISAQGAGSMLTRGGNPLGVIGGVAPMLSLVAGFGGVPAGVGLLIFLWGRSLRRKR